MLSKIINLLKTDEIDNKRQVLEILTSNNVEELRLVSRNLRHRAWYLEHEQDIKEVVSEQDVSEADLTKYSLIYQCIKLKKEYSVYKILRRAVYITKKKAIATIINGGYEPSKWEFTEDGELIIYEEGVTND